MERYTVNITDAALADMENIYNYIAYELLAPENARGQYDRIAEEQAYSIEQHITGNSRLRRSGKGHRRKEDGDAEKLQSSLIWKKNNECPAD